MENLTTFLLFAAITLIALGIHTNNLILTGIGGFLVGVYNAIMHEMRLKEK